MRGDIGYNARAGSTRSPAEAYPRFGGGGHSDEPSTELCRPHLPARENLSVRRIGMFG